MAEIGQRLWPLALLPIQFGELGEARGSPRLTPRGAVESVFGLAVLVQTAQGDAQVVISFPVFGTRVIARGTVERRRQPLARLLVKPPFTVEVSQRGVHVVVARIAPQGLLEVS